MPLRPASRAFTLEVDHVLPEMTMAPRKLGGSGRACQPDGRPAAARVRVLGDRVARRESAWAAIGPRWSRP
jgi:hypothetical protein